jgi:hypothetical protein
MKKMMMAMFVSMMILISCSSSISQSAAEKIAQDFVAKNVKFFAKSENSSSLVGEVSAPIPTSYQEGDVWVVVLHVTGNVNGTTKQNDLVVKVDSKGNVLEFNGQKISQAE